MGLVFLTTGWRVVGLVVVDEVAAISWTWACSTMVAVVLTPESESLPPWKLVEAYPSEMIGRRSFLLESCGVFLEGLGWGGSCKE